MVWSNACINVAPTVHNVMIVRCGTWLVTAETDEIPPADAAADCVEAIG
jgi:hypothetical protein